MAILVTHWYLFLLDWSSLFQFGIYSSNWSKLKEEKDYNVNEILIDNKKVVLFLKIKVASMLSSH